MHNSTTRSLAIATTLLGFSASAQAAVVLIIDVSNKSAVTFTATNALSQTNSSLNASTQGFTVENFFTALETFPSTSTLTGTLSPSSGTAAFYAGFGTFEFDDNDGVFKAANDLSIFALGNEGANSQVFQTTAAPFTGVATFDFTSASLPTNATQGNVYSGFFKSGTADHGEIVGQWIVVPEPSTTLLLGLGACSLLSRRRRTV